MIDSYHISLSRTWKRIIYRHTRNYTPKWIRTGLLKLSNVHQIHGAYGQDHRRLPATVQRSLVINAVVSGHQVLALL